VVGKVTSVVFGLITIGTAIMVNSLRSLNLFDLFQILNAMLLPPMIVPMVLGVFIKRTPDWAGWSTVLAGFAGALVAKGLYSAVWVQSMLGLDRGLTPRELVDSQYIVISAVTWLVSVSWFLGSMRFWRRSAPEHRQRVEALFEDLHRPVDHMGEGGENQDAMQYRIVGLLSVTMGGFLLLCMAIPNGLRGRLCFLIIGGILMAMGLGFQRANRKQITLDATPD
jgi:hypothetical protein